MQSSENTSPVRDSPSRRSRLLGSLRSIGSLRSLRTPHSHSKHSQSDDSPSEAELLGTPCKQMPPLFLDFEVSPPDKPMFDTASRTTSSSSSLEVHHSSPITMAQSNRKHLGASLASAKLSPFIIGGPPDSPAPLQRAFAQESFFSAVPANETTEHSPTSQNYVLKDSVSTPMPGTNLTLEDAVAPGIATEDATTTSLRHDYFKAIPTEDAYQKHTDSTVPSDPLSMDDPRFDEMMGKTDTEVPSDIYQAWPKHPGSKSLGIQQCLLPTRTKLSRHSEPDFTNTLYRRVLLTLTSFLRNLHTSSGMIRQPQLRALTSKSGNQGLGTFPLILRTVTHMAS